ncbi:MAG: ankyrin repeat domain-containing protein [Aureliella sp.]
MSYKIQFSFDAQVLDFVSDEPVPVQVQDLSISEEKIENFLPLELAQRGIIGGEVSLTASPEKATVTITYWAPGPVDDSLVQGLLEATHMQVVDGLGEGGFPFHRGDRLLVALADIDAEPVPSIIEDAREVLPPPQIAVAARNGNLESLKAALESDASRIDASFQGYSALHYALIYGPPEMAELLINAGADVNFLDPQGDSPLMRCALANHLDDQQSAAIGKLLIENGARVQLRDDAGRTAKDLAEIRRKPRLAALL